MSNKVFRIFFLALSLLLSGMIAGEEHKRPMKILMVVACFPKIHDICMLNQMTGLIDRGHDVYIYALSKGDYVHVQEDVIKYDLINKTFFETIPARLDDFDIIMFQLGHKIFDVKKTHNFKGKVVVCLRGYDITGFLKEKPHAYDEYFESCDLFMPVCEVFKNILMNIGCSEDKIIVQHSAIDCSKFKFKKRSLPRSGILKIVSAGRFVEKKGFIYSIRAVGQLLKKFPQLRYTIIGDGILKKKYRRIIKKLNLETKIKIDSWHAHEEYIDILNESHIFLAPSVTAQNNDQEGIPNVLKEAMAMGLLVVATDHSGNPEIVANGKTGFLVPERNSSAICKSIEYILNNPEQWESIQVAAMKKILEEFELEKENDKLEAILYGLLA